MYSKLIALKTDNLSKEDILKFISHWSSLIYGGQGGSNQFAKLLPVSEVDGLRIFLGVPETWLTTERRQVFEAMYCYCFQLPFGPHPDIWTNTPNWPFSNPNSVPMGANLDICVLDLAYVNSLGVRNYQWEKSIFKTSLKSYLARVQCNEPLNSQNLRLFMALALFGFPNPYDFFTEDRP